MRVDSDVDRGSFTAHVHLVAAALRLEQSTKHEP